MNRINELCGLIMNPNGKYLTDPEYELACKLACWLEINMESKTSKR